MVTQTAPSDLTPAQSRLLGRPSIELRDVSKFFGEVQAVNGISLEVRQGEFLTLLGPSGCGKTTTLRMIGGFELPSAGEIFIEGEAMGDRPPYRRPVNTVFQNYALFPHMTVAQNVSYGLEMAGVAKAERQKRVQDALDMVRLPHVEGRKPAELSGGQQQRVALARALVNRPAVLLLDEPLGALDLKLRKEMQLELKQIQQDVGATFLYVTHDQEEALTMSDRIAVMNEGRISLLGDLPGTEAPGSNALTGRLDEVVYVGTHTQYLVRLPGGQLLTVYRQNRAVGENEHAIGEALSVVFEPQSAS